MRLLSAVYDSDAAATEPHYTDVFLATIISDILRHRGAFKTAVHERSLITFSFDAPISDLVTYFVFLSCASAILTIIPLSDLKTGLYIQTQIRGCVSSETSHSPSSTSKPSRKLHSEHLSQIRQTCSPKCFSYQVSIVPSFGIALLLQVTISKRTVRTILATFCNHCLITVLYSPQLPMTYSLVF